MLKLVAWLPLRLAESRLGGRVAAWSARHIPRLLPVRRVALTEGAFAMLHPIPQYPDHVVITPRTYVADLPTLVAAADDRGRAEHAESLRVTLDLARALDRSRPPGGRIFTISTGTRLHVKHVHGHLVAESDAFWIADDDVVANVEVARPTDSPTESPTDSPDAAVAVLDALAVALERAGGGHAEGSVVFAGLQEERLRITVTVAPHPAPDIAPRSAEG